MFFLRHHLTPDQRAELPNGMGKWLTPYAIVMDKLNGG